MKKLFVLLAAAAISFGCVFAGCSKIADNTEHFDEITKTLKLEKSYEGKKLMSDDGIGLATLPGDTTDGDTTYFSLAEGGGVTVRYQGVNTPESTARVKKWGKAASLFTNERLHLATEIVIESASGGVPEKDTQGGRSLCYVWYKTEEDDFKLLNLELVENGYSLNKDSPNSSYYTYFQKAEKFANGIKLRLHSDLDDPLFDTSLKELSLKDLKENPANYEENSKVHLHAYLLDKKTTGTGSVTFTIGQYDEETNKVYSINLYAGYSGASATNMMVGDVYHLVGTLQRHDGVLQISGVEYENSFAGNEKSERSWRAQLSYYLIFNAENKLYTMKDSYNCYGNVTVASVDLDGSTLTFEGSAKNTADETETFTFTVTVPEGYDGAIKVGSELVVSGGYQFEAGSGVIAVTDYSNITIK